MFCCVLLPGGLPCAKDVRWLFIYSQCGTPEHCISFLTVAAFIQELHIYLAYHRSLDWLAVCSHSIIQTDTTLYTSDHWHSHISCSICCLRNCSHLTFSQCIRGMTIHAGYSRRSCMLSCVTFVLSAVTSMQSIYLASIQLYPLVTTTVTTDQVGLTSRSTQITLEKVS